MTALTEGRATPSRADHQFRGPVAASTTCYEGGIACRDASGNLVPGSTALSLVAVGIFTARGANAAGSAGDVNVTYASGCFRLGNASSTDAITDDDIGEIAWIVDDQTVAKRQAGTRSAAGLIVDVDDVGVWVQIGRHAASAGRHGVPMGSLSNKATDTAVLRWVAPFAGTIAKVWAVLNAALATGDATLTLAIGGTGVTGGVITQVQASSAAGQVATATPTALATFAAGDVITVTGGGASTATSTSTVTLLVTPHA